MENLNKDEDVNTTWENIKENIKTSAKESLGVHEWKQHKPWFDEECLGFLDQRKRTKTQWVQDPSQSNVDNLNSVRCVYPCKRDLAPLVQDAWWASGLIRMGTKHIAPTRVQMPDHLTYPGCIGTVFNEKLIGKNMKVSSCGLI